MNPPPGIAISDIHIGSIGILDNIELTHPTYLRAFLLNCVNSVL